jgi:predicted  nucleic acid-binding Zn-ribbon protein
MSPELERLIDLQRLDDAIEDARRKVAAHPQRLAEADARLAEARARVDAAKQRLKANQDARRELEKEAAVFQGRLTKYKDQLSAVKTNREYQAMQQEMATATTELGGVEEKVLERMLEADGITADIKTAEAALAAQQKDVSAEKARLEQELSVVQKALAEATGKRAALLPQIDQRVIAKFDQVARARKGIAMATATRDGLCSVCHVRLRPHVFQQIRQNDTIIQCESCQRILYYVPPQAAAEAPVTQPS